VGSKLDETGISDKVKTGAKTVGTKTVEYGGIAYNKTKEGIVKIATNEKVQEYSGKAYKTTKEIGSKAFEGAKEIGSSVWGFFSNATKSEEAKAPSGSENSGAGTDVPD
jgi:hypothetical protein